MTDRRDESRCRIGTDGSLASRRVARRVLLLGGYVVAGWVGLCAFGGHHAEAAAAPAPAPSAHAGLLDAVTASATSGPRTAVAAPGNAALALPHLSDLAPLHTVLDATAPAQRGADSSSSIVDRVGSVGSVADLPGAAQIGKPVEDTLTAVTAPVRHIPHVVDPVTRTLPSGTGSVVDTITDHVTQVTDVVPGSTSAPGTAPAPVDSPAPAPRSTAPVTAAHPRDVHRSTETAARHSDSATSERVSATPVPALDPAPNAARPQGPRVLPAAGAHPQDATQTPRGSLRSGAGAPMAPPQSPQTPGPIPVLPGSVAVAGASGTTSPVGSGFSGSALFADQLMIAAQFRAVHTVQHDNARIARAEAAAPSCSPD